MINRMGEPKHPFGCAFFFLVIAALSVFGIAFSVHGASIGARLLLVGVAVLLLVFAWLNAWLRGTGR
jgi:hypothetical protein